MEGRSVESRDQHSDETSLGSAPMSGTDPRTTTIQVISAVDLAKVMDGLAKSIDTLSSRMTDDSQKLRQELKSNSEQLRQELKSNSEQLRQELKSNSEQLRQELKSNSEQLREEVKSSSEKLREELRTQGQLQDARMEKVEKSLANLAAKLESKDEDSDSQDSGAKGPSPGAKVGEETSADIPKTKSTKPETPAKKEESKEEELESEIEAGSIMENQSDVTPTVTESPSSSLSDSSYLPGSDVATFIPSSEGSASIDVSKELLTSLEGEPSRTKDAEEKFEKE